MSLCTVNLLVLLGGVETLGGVSVSEKLASSLPETESVRGGPKALGGVRPRITTSRNIRKTRVLRIPSEGSGGKFPRNRNR